MPDVSLQKFRELLLKSLLVGHALLTSVRSHVHVPQEVSQGLAKHGADPHQGDEKRQGHDKHADRLPQPTRFGEVGNRPSQPTKDEQQRGRMLQSDER